MKTDVIRGWFATTNGRVAIAAAAFAIVLALALSSLVDDQASTLARSTTAIPSSAPVAATQPEPATIAAAVGVVEPAHGDDEVQMCDGSWVKLGADGQISEKEAEAFGRRTFEKVEAPTLAAMEAGGDERARAAAHFFQAAAPALLPGCDGDEACARSGDDGQRSAEGHRTALVRIAQTSSDPQIYAWAYQACANASSNAGSACQLVNAEQWARIDGGNAVPWLVIAGDAEKRKDMSTLDDAMFHVASAQRHDTGWGALPALLAAHVPAGDTSIIGALELEVGAIGVEAAVSMPYSTVTRYCSAASIVDANRRDVCDRTAALLVDRSSTLLALGVGANMAKRLDWPEERLSAIQNEREALASSLPQEAENFDGYRNCKVIRRTVDRIRDVGRFGEVGELRRTIAASGKTTGQLAAAYREHVAELQDKAHREVAAASAAVPVEGDH